MQSACSMRLAGMEDTAELLEKKQASEISKMSLEEAPTLTRAFSHYLNLMGIAEVHHRSLNDLGKKKKIGLNFIYLLVTYFTTNRLLLASSSVVATLNPQSMN
ncbi:putative phosphoenolpyruvate carboxylase [Rosa chinensis]|uniref:Putative phosphoenolpyruvate carboxylase n=1 Tax=Rosa chinensis TaxID=74649 RepID=A0A2P6RRQ4_ROSCH|nr:putative phosphoenolpyruvate carboxylase [Rosa chinensis]